MDDQAIRDIEKHKKKSLNRYQKNLACIRRLEEKLGILDERITTVKSPSLSGMPRGGIPVTIADLISDKVELEKRIERLKAKGQDLKAAVYEEIDSIEEPRYCEILEAHYINGKTFETIAEDMGYTERYIYMLYAEAITLLVEKE